MQKMCLLDEYGWSCSFKHGLPALHLHKSPCVREARSEGRGGSQVLQMFSPCSRRVTAALQDTPFDLASWLVLKHCVKVLMI